MLLSQLTWPAVKQLSRDIPVVIPIAAVEQHGAHLPLVTDSALLGEIVRRVELEISDEILVTPLMWLGNSDHHLDFAGTLSAPPRVYLDLLVGLVNNLLHHGFRRLLLLNGHGGNDVPGKQALFEVRQQWRERNDLLLLFTTYWSLGSIPWEGLPDIQQREMGHACEWETSMMLCISPELVGEYGKLQTVEFGRPFTPATRAWITQERSIPGHIGSPQLATLAKGEHLLTTFSNDATQLIHRMRAWDGNAWEG